MDAVGVPQIGIVVRQGIAVGKEDAVGLAGSSQGIGPVGDVVPLGAALEGRQPDYLIVQHMEPDHSGSVAAFMQRYPDAQVVSSAKAFSMMQAFSVYVTEDMKIQTARSIP